jgi:alpha-L-fucosidase 2
MRAAADEDMAALLFQYGRYLMIAGSRPGRAAAESSGDLEQLRAAAVGVGVYDEHQPGDELLAGRDDEPVGVPRAAAAHGARAERRRRKDREAALRPAGLAAASQHDHLARHAAGGRQFEGVLLDGLRGWLCSHLWEHYQFTQDERFLRERRIRT